MAKPFQYLDFWNGKYSDGHTPWDLGRVSRPVELLLEAAFPQQGRVFIPGSGRGYEALHLAGQGYAVTAVDYADEAVTYLSDEARRQGLDIDVRKQDIFDLPPEFDAAFDVLLEQTCFCAINPKDRAAYEAMAHRVLKPGGRLLGVFMEVPFDNGPPFNCPADVVQAFFPEARWHLDAQTPVEPQEPMRPGPEYLLCYTRK
jgi:SAM-dependent methyltransferase